MVQSTGSIEANGQRASKWWQGNFPCGVEGDYVFQENSREGISSLG